MANNLTLAEAIVNAVGTGKIPEELTALDTVSASATIANGTTASAVTDASTTHALNIVFSDTEVEAALNALGTKMNSILAALRTFKVIAP